MVATTFWHPDGTPMSAQQFMEMLFGKLPEFFKNEAELRALWSAPETRKKLLQGLAEKGFGDEQLAEMQKIIDAEKSDLFDVLAHVAYALPPLTREERAAKAKVASARTSTASSRSFSTSCSLTTSASAWRSWIRRSYALAAAEVSQLHRGRHRRPGPRGGDWAHLRWLPEVSLSAGSRRMTGDNNATKDNRTLAAASESNRTFETE